MNNIGRDGNKRDRKLGDYWEDRYIDIAKAYGWRVCLFNRLKGSTFTDENGRRYVSPDVWAISRDDKQYICEIKHKNLAKNNCYGFEAKREDSMLSIEGNYSNKHGGVVALYVVHDHDLAGGKFVKLNKLSHWCIGLLASLARDGHRGKPVRTYYNRKVTDKPVPIMYYPLQLFRPLKSFLDDDGAAFAARRERHGY